MGIFWETSGTFHSGKIWYSRYVSDKSQKTIKIITSMSKCREIYAGAKIDDELFALMCKPETREQLRAILIETYFAPEIQVKVLEQGQLNYAAYQYSEKLLKVAEWKKQFEKPEEEPNEEEKTYPYERNNKSTDRFPPGKMVHFPNSQDK